MDGQDYDTHKKISLEKYTKDISVYEEEFVKQWIQPLL